MSLAVMTTNDLVKQYRSNPLCESVVEHTSEHNDSETLNSEADKTKSFLSYHD
jgi:hypothetical protein